VVAVVGGTVLRVGVGVDVGVGVGADVAVVVAVADRGVVGAPPAVGLDPGGNDAVGVPAAG
jgi:hypothetical protein